MAIEGLLSLTSTKVPSIHQYSVFDKRNDDKEFNFGENYGGFLFGLYDGGIFSQIPIDPRYLNVSIVQVLQNKGELSFADISISVDLFTKENFPQEYEDDIFDENFTQASILYSSKDLNKLVLKNGLFGNNSKNIGIILGPCV